MNGDLLATGSIIATFTLTDTSGQQVSLADYYGKKNVVLYFNEGAGRQSCIMQMGAIEKQKAAFDKTDTIVLPIVMNTKDQIQHDMALNGVTTPFLLDDGNMSTAYGTIGKGMHAGLPGHSFVLIDKNGTQRWYGEYPSMWLSPDDLLKEITTRLKGVTNREHGALAAGPAAGTVRKRWHYRDHTWRRDLTPA